MLLDVCFGTKSVWRILFVLAEAPGKAIERKEIQRLTRLGNKVLSKFLTLLEKFEIILVEKSGRKHNYKLNLTNPFTEQALELIRAEKKQLNNPEFPVLTVLREFVYELTNLNLENLKKVILFGSYAKRTQHEGSDIDVALILKEKDVNDELLITESIGRIKKRFGKEIQPHYYTEKEFSRQSKDKLVQDIIKDGIRLV